MNYILLFLTFSIGSVLAQTAYSVPAASSLNSTNFPLKTASASISTVQAKNQIINNVPLFSSKNLAQIAVNSQNSKQDLNISALNLNVLLNAQKQLTSPVKALENIFSRIPSKDEIFKIVQQADIASLTLTLKAVSSDSQLSCNSKTSYLMDLHGIVKNNIKVKSNDVEVQSVLSQIAKENIQRIQQQINKKQKEQKDLKIDIADKKVVDLSIRFNNFSNQIVTLNSQIYPEQARIIGLEKQIQTIANQSQTERNLNSIYKLHLVEVVNLIRDLEGRLEKAKKQKANIEQNINQSESFLANNQNKIQRIRFTINETNLKIKALRDKSDTIKRQSNSLEVDLQRARTDLSVKKITDDKLTGQIQRLNRRKAQQQSKITQEYISYLKRIITNSKNIIPQINSQINRIYYYCYGQGIVEASYNGNSVIYIINADNFFDYIKSVYGLTMNNQLRTNTDIRLQVIDPTFQLSSYKLGQRNSSGLNKSFYCSNQEVTSQIGRVLGIESTGLIIQGVNGRTNRLILAECTRIQSTTPFIQVGQNIAWKGSITSPGRFNLYGATCW